MYTYTLYIYIYTHRYIPSWLTIDRAVDKEFPDVPLLDHVFSQPYSAVAGTDKLVLERPSPCTEPRVRAPQKFCAEDDFFFWKFANVVRKK